MANGGPELGIISLTRIRPLLKFIHVKQAFMDQVSALFIICFTLSESRDERGEGDRSLPTMTARLHAAHAAPRKIACHGSVNFSFYGFRIARAAETPLTSSTHTNCRRFCYRLTNAFCHAPTKTIGDACPLKGLYA